MPSEDPRLEPLFYGGEPPSDALHNLVGAATLWSSDPDWMDLLDPGSPAHDSKLLERDLYLHHWRRHLQGRQRVLDLGGGAGRFTQWLLARGCEVELADPDLRSLWRTLGHVAGGPGRLYLATKTSFAPAETRVVSHKGLRIIRAGGGSDTQAIPGIGLRL